MKDSILFQKFKMKILKFIKKKFIFYKNYLKYKNLHLKNEISTINKSIIFNSIPMLNLENSNEWIVKKKKSKLISYTGSDNVNGDQDYPLIESWLQINNKTYTPNNFYLYQQHNNICLNSNKKDLVIEEPLYVLPYYTSVFGHFAGDVLGSTIYYLENYIKNYKLFCITPSEFWTNFLKERFQERLIIYKPKKLLEFNILFQNSYVLPRINTVQNYILSNNILNKYLDINLSTNNKIFLTTGRKDRISNITEVIDFLEKRQFEIVYPQRIPIVELLSKIKFAKVLISEKASALENIHLCRNNPYYILSSRNENINTKEKFSYAGIYKSLHKGLYNEIFCDDDPIDQNSKPYKKRIFVDLQKLKEF
tara:strand:+ start:768 stop:1862 length:1095 start_codon:yes stop_codon:yes gene_type:complete